MMKNLLLILTGAFLLTSCEITERVYIDENGDVSYSTIIDASSLIMMMPEDFSNEKLPLDTILTVEGLAEADMDMVFTDINVNDKDELELLQDFKFHVKMDEKSASTASVLEKRSISEFNSVMRNLNKKVNEINEKRKVQNLSLDPENQLSDLDIPILSTPNLTYDGKTFTRKGEIRNLVPQNSDEFDGLESLIKFNLEYHFPKSIEWISDESIRMSADRKTIYLEKSFQHLVENPDAYNFEVRF